MHKSAKIKLRFELLTILLKMAYNSIVLKKHRCINVFETFVMVCGVTAKDAALAQLDRVFGYEPKGQGFESLTPYQDPERKFRVFRFCGSLFFGAPHYTRLKDLKYPFCCEHKQGRAFWRALLHLMRINSPVHS